MCNKNISKKKDKDITPIKITPKLIFAGVLQSFYILLWFSGLAACGPLNTIILETSDIAVIGLLGGIMGINPSGMMTDKIKGSVMLLVGYILLGFSGSVSEDIDPIAMDPEDSKLNKLLKTIHNPHPLQGVIYLLISGLFNFLSNYYTKTVQCDVNEIYHKRSIICYISSIPLLIITLLYSGNFKE